MFFTGALHALPLPGSNSGSVINVHGTFTLMDSAPNAAHTGEYEGLPAGGVITGVRVDNFGTFSMDGGTITGNTVTGDGGGVYNNDTFTMTGGTITGNTATGNGGGVFLLIYSTFTMDGGRISDNIASGSLCDGGGVYLGVHSDFTMNGGEISGNTASTNGGGVAISNPISDTVREKSTSTFTMNGGAISGNVSGAVVEGGTGGVFMNNDDTFIMNGGTISGNSTGKKANGGGGGVYLSNDSLFIMTGGSITGNHARPGADSTESDSFGGGGVYYSGQYTKSKTAHIILSGTAEITGNYIGQQKRAGNIGITDHGFPYYISIGDGGFQGKAGVHFPQYLDGSGNYHKPDYSNPYMFAGNAAESDLAGFTSDDGNVIGYFNGALYVGSGLAANRSTNKVYGSL